MEIFPSFVADGLGFSHLRGSEPIEDFFTDVKGDGEAIAVVVESHVGELRSDDGGADVVRGTHRTDDDWPVHREVLGCLVNVSR